MPITPRLSQKLHQTLGDEAGAEFVNWIHRIDARADDVATRGDFAALRADFAELRAEFSGLRAEFAGTRETTRADITDVRQTMRADIAELRHEMQVGFAKMQEEMARLEARFERRFGDLIKWSFVFWVGAVGAIAMLAGVLR